ncbi:hypothetical protein ABTY61_13250 [Kitasatospora sp. NPDC096128]|uniref:hypothetical protein n=1 Tax=Kitasatospora sp. NPDC096128 TaxID=3155547 RepID=UPI0033208E4E
MKTTKKTLRHMAMAVTAGVLALAGTMVSAGTAQAEDRSGMNEPGILFQGDRLTAGDTSLIMQGDGNLVLYRGVPSAPYPVWVAPNTLGCGYKAIMQGDGNFVVYNAASKPCWASNTFKSDPNSLASVGVFDKGGLAIGFATPPGHSVQWIGLRSSDLY